MYNVAVITISTTGAKGERVDVSGPLLVDMLKNNDFDVKYTNIITDDFDIIKNELLKVVNMNIDLIITTGGTGFSKTDITPEATKSIIEKETPGISEFIRFENMKITNRACLSRGVSGICKNSLIINLPGSKKAVEESLSVIIEPMKHGLLMLKTEGSANCGE